MHKLTPQTQTPFAALVYNEAGQVTGSQVLLQDTCQVILLNLSLLQNFLEAGVGYGYVNAAGLFVVQDVRHVRVLNLPDGARHYTALAALCGGEEHISPDAVLDYVAAHPEEPEFAALGISVEKVERQERLC